MLTNQSWRAQVQKFLATSCLVFFAVITILAKSPSYAMAALLYPASGRAGEVYQKVDAASHLAVEEEQFTFEPKSGILAEVNKKFHDDYDEQIREITSTFTEPGGPTVLVFTMNKLILFHNGIREEQEFIPSLYHELKAIEHHPLALYVTLEPHKGKELTDSLKNFLRERSDLLQNTSIGLNKQDWSPNIVDNQKLLLKDSIEYIDRVLGEGRINSERLNSYVQQVTPKIIRGVNEAAAAELEIINEKIKSLLAKDEWEDPYVVICSVHQARNGELVTQYFEHMFNEFQGEGAGREDRIVYAESIFDDEEKALRLLATHILDRKIAWAFFRDPRRLQSDALMDAANFWLWEHAMDIPKWP
jgi:hypothetical protein